MWSDYNDTYSRSAIRSTAFGSSLSLLSSTSLSNASLGSRNFRLDSDDDKSSVENAAMEDLSVVNVGGDNLTDYNYDYDESVGSLPVNEMVVNGVGYGMVLLTGLAGNTLVIASVARYRRMHNITNIFLLSLATADLLLVCVCVPVKFARFFTFTWRLGEVMCKGVHYLQNVSIICSVLNLTGLSLERYYAIMYPMKARYMCTVKLARRSVIGIWILSLIMALPIIAGQAHFLVGGSRKGYWCMERWPELVYQQVYQLYMLLVVYILPLAFMTCTYVSICRRLWQVRYQRASIRAGHSCSVRGAHNLLPILMTSPPSSTGDACPVQRGEFRLLVRQTTSGVRCKRGAQSEDATRKQVVKMLVAVVALFALCWGPIIVNNVLVAFRLLEELHMGPLKPMRQAFWLLAYLNSCLNPIVYGFMSKNFRDSFRNTIWQCVLRKVPAPDQANGIYWRCLFQQVPSGASLSVHSPSVFSDNGRFLTPPSLSMHRLSTQSTTSALAAPQLTPSPSLLLTKVACYDPDSCAADTENKAE